MTDHPVELFETETGRYWLPTDAGGDDLIAAIRADKVHGQHVVDEAGAHIRLGSTVLDVGANFGQMTMLFAKMVGPTGLVHSFEACPFICSLLRRNLEENWVKNVIVHEGAVWHEDGLTLFYPEQDFCKFAAYGSFGIEPNATEGRTVKSLTIDSLDIQGDISLIKVDVQGADLFAMMGARHTLLRSRAPVIFEFEDCFQTEYKTAFDDYVKFAESISYRIPKNMWWDYLMMPEERLIDQNAEMVHDHGG